jgi:signal recognition particle subunit SEC65
MDPSTFQVIYPSYMDSTKTIAEGRRIGAEKAVDTPTVSDISQALQSLKIRHVLQPYKGYSRDISALWDNPGRVKVEIPQDMSKRQVMYSLAEIIPTLAPRLQRLEQEKQQKEMEQKAKEEAALRDRQAQKQLQQQRQTTAVKGNKKKGKKKR